MSRLLLIVTAVGSLLSASPHGQTAFEAASIKLNRSGEQRSTFNTPANRFVATNVTLHELTAWAYGDPGPPPELRSDFQMSGGPAWSNSDKFDVEATAVGVPPGGVESTRLKMRMLQALLAERFKLVVRHETREGAIYSLVRANRDGRLGPRLLRSDVDCTVPAPQCGIRVSLSGLRFGGQTVPAMARLLARALQRPVIDRTALDGAFDLNLEFDPSGLPGANRPPEAGPGPDLSDKPSLYTALQEQAGLKLESGRGPIDVLVIESASHPADN